MNLKENPKNDAQDLSEDAKLLHPQPRTNLTSRSKIFSKRFYSLGIRRPQNLNYDDLYVTQINQRSSPDRLKQIVKDAQKRKSSKFNWHALSDLPLSNEVVTP